MSKVHRRGRGRPPILSHILTPDVHHRQVRLGLVLSLAELERLAELSCSEQGIGDPAGIDFYFSGKEIDEAIRAIMPRLEMYAGHHQPAAQADQGIGDGADRAILLQSGLGV